MTSQITHSDIPARLDRLGWSRFHLLVVVALGSTWVLDSIGPALQDPRTLALSPAQVGSSASA